MDDAPTPPELVEIPAGPDRLGWIPLLELADEPGPLLKYIGDGDLYGFVAPDGAPQGAILVIDVAPGVAELRAVAVDGAFQGRGIGTLMINTVLFVVAQRGAQRAIVGTASSGVRQLAFYQRCGFRLSHIERDFFTPEKGYPADLSENGIRIRDMVWMDRDLASLSLGG